MLSPDKIKSDAGREDRNGFSLVVVILALLILTALGFLAMSVTTTDLQITNRIVGEKKALTAAEAGIHILTTTFSPANITAITGHVDAVADPASTYRISVATRPTAAGAPGFLPMKGYSIAGGQEWGQKMYETSVTGENSNYGSSVQIDLGFGYFDGGGVMYR
ncbi:MAG: hypothetical protein CVU55_15360 [Deltaproteobacteria bacterium HGW-Deltaproteobacteria-13]|jgi:Tfp pilus assembly protein PilX|nr:MAG: hypothetical protein CVU55_15360 [Deltaproteobacteria bacterium HGW-Deltaproteobacteria-13]